MATSIRLRFEVFKRDKFSCQYCGRSSPECILEVDHIVPLSAGGTNDIINLTTSCWDCNRGKSDVPLNELRTGEDPHDLAIALTEKSRQLKEYNRVLSRDRKRREKEANVLFDWWCEHSGQTKIPTRQITWLENELQRTPSERIRQAMGIAISRHAVLDWRYVMVVLRNWREDAKGVERA